MWQVCLFYSQAREAAQEGRFQLYVHTYYMYYCNRFPETVIHAPDHAAKTLCRGV